jgi:DNA polymerase
MRSPLDDLCNMAFRCTACPRWRGARQTVFGEGSARATVVLVGEQPGESEDRAGRPFVGAAGRLLDQALVLAGLDRNAVYLTDAVKHFKWTARGKRRILKPPAQREIDACRQWLEGEIQTIAPKMVVCLGPTALRAVLGKSGSVGPARRGRVVVRAGEPALLATIHPSYVLRGPPQERSAAHRELVAALRVAAQFVARN